MRLLLRSGVTFPVLMDLLRDLYLDVARRDVLTDPKARTDSRVSLLTGIHRKELRRQRAPEGASAAPAAPAVVTVNTQIIGRWLGAPAYTDAAGQPLPLPRAGAEPSFEALVSGVTRDVRPRAVLDEWLGQGLVTLDAEGRVQLQAAAYLPREGSEAQLFYFARNVHDHLAAAVANVLAGKAAPFLDRSVHYDRLGLDAAAALEAEARDGAQRLLLEMNRTALRIAEEDDKAAAAAGAERPTRRVNLGVYLFVEDEPPRAAE